MHRSFVRTALAAGLFLGLGLSVQAADTPAAKTTAFEVDPVHSSVSFAIGHLDVSTTRGRFDTFEGSFVQAADPSNSSIHMEVDAASVNTGNAKRDGHVKSPDFLDAVQFPTFTFKSTSVKRFAAEDLEVTGDFTLHGVTKSITVIVRKVGEAESERFGHKVGYDTAFTINRSEFGMTQMLGGIGDEVTITLSIEADAK